SAGRYVLFSQEGSDFFGRIFLEVEALGETGPMPADFLHFGANRFVLVRRQAIPKLHDVKRFAGLGMLRFRHVERSAGRYGGSFGFGLFLLCCLDRKSVV